MIPNLTTKSVAFKGNENHSVRDAYNALLEKNSQIVNSQNNLVTSANLTNNIPMQGNVDEKCGKKLDLIA